MSSATVQYTLHCRIGNSTRYLILRGTQMARYSSWVRRRVSLKNTSCGRCLSKNRTPCQDLQRRPAGNLDWETEESTEEPLLSLILVSTHLPTTILFALPPSITRLALIDLPTPIPLHRLPKLCPMLILLDLSYNKWLQAQQAKAQNP